MQDRVQHYLNLGMTPCPIEARSKKPIHNDWPNTDRDQVEDLFAANPGCNVGIVLGDASGGIVDVDLDSEEALKIAPTILPKTGYRFGRTSKPNSHYIYRCPNPDRTRQFRNPLNGSTLIELRANGGVTAFPGSIHPSGEPVEFSGNAGNMSEINRDALERACALVAVGSVVLPSWLSGSRHSLALATSGLLATVGVGLDDARRVIGAIASSADDDELEDRLRAVQTTYDRHTSGEPIEFVQTLTDLVGPKVLRALRQWLGQKKVGQGTETRLPVPSKGADDFKLSMLSTDLDAGNLFSVYLRDHLLYADGSKIWYAANNHVHEPISQERVMEQAIKFVGAAAGHVRSPSDLPIVKSLSSVARMRGMIEVAKPQLRADHTTFDLDPWIAGCLGGVLDLRERELVEPESVVTKRLGAAYDPNARCPIFQGFLDEIFNGDREVIGFLQRAAGYCLTGSTAEQCLFVLTGTGANGKSTLLNIFGQLMGQYSGSVPMHTLMVSLYGRERTDDLAALRGVRFVSAQEGEAGERLAEAKIKLITGGDKISCRRLYQAYEEYVPQFKLWLATNDLPKVQGTSEAIWRRLHVIQFPVEIPAGKRDGHLGEKLRAELSGILNWALDGLSAWRSVGLNPPESVLEATSAYRGESDSVGQFIAACCITDPNACTSVKALYLSFTMWCEASGIDPMPNSQFGKELSRLGLETVKANTGNKRRGIKLIKPVEEPQGF